MTTLSVIQITDSGMIDATTPQSWTFVNPPVAGHSVFVSISLKGSTPTVTAVTDNQSNTYVKYDSLGYASGDTELWWCQTIGAVTGSFTVSFTQSGGTAYVMSLMEAAGIIGSDKNTSATGAGGGASPISVTMGAANAGSYDLVIAVNQFGIGYTTGPLGMQNPPGNNSVSGNFITWSFYDTGVFGTNPAGFGIGSGYKIVPTVETSTAAWTFNTISGGREQMLLATFQGNPPPVPANIVQQTGSIASAGGATCTCPAFTNPVTTGNTLVVAAYLFATTLGASNHPVLSDGTANTYTLVGYEPGPGNTFGLTFTATPTGTSATLTSAFSGSTSNSYTIFFSDGEIRVATLTNASTAVTWTTALTGSPAVTATAYANSEGLAFFYCEGCIGGTLTPQLASTAGYTIFLYAAEVTNIAKSGGFLGSSFNVQFGPGGALNAITSGAVTIAQKAVLFGFSFDSSSVSANALAGGTGFNAQPGVWPNSTFLIGMGEDATVSTSTAATFTTTNTADTFFTGAMAFAYGSPLVLGQVPTPGPGVSPAKRLQFVQAPRSTTVAPVFNPSAGPQPAYIPTAGPGISPESRFQFSTLEGNTTPLGQPNLSIAVIVEGYDIVVATGSTSNTASAAIIEGYDIVVVQGSTASTGATAAITEGYDIVAGVGQAAGAIGIGVVVEGYDLVQGTGSTKNTGNASIIEGYDSVVGIGLQGITGSAAIVEGYDFVVVPANTRSVATAAIIELQDIVISTSLAATTGIAAIVEGQDLAVIAASGLSVGSAAIIEGHDIVVSIDSVLNVGTAAIVEGHDYITLINSGSATILEGLDAVRTVAAQTPVTFGYAIITALTQVGGSTGPIQGARSTYIEGSACFVTAQYFSNKNTPFEPLDVSYRIDDVQSGANILPWTSITSEVENTVTVPGILNAMVSDSRNWETHQILFQITDGFDNVFEARTLWDIIAVRGFPVPDENFGVAAIVEGGDIVGGGD